MFSKLRKKFIIIMMSMVTLILVAVFGILIFVNINRSRDTMESFMKRELMMRVGKERFRLPPGDRTETDKPNINHFPSLIVKSDDGVISDVIDRDLQPDEDIEKMFRRALESRDKDGFGRFPQDNIRFFVNEAENRADVIFSDNRFEDENQKTFIFLCLIGFFCAEAGFFVLSYFLSGWALKPIREAWERQSRFIADASHELKTPITVMLADTDILLSNENDEISEHKRWIESIRDEAHSMKSLIEEMLYIARSDAKAQNYEIKDVNISNLVMDKILEYESVAYEGKINLTNEVDDDIIASVDENAMDRVLAILFDNAFKYCSEDAKGRNIDVKLAKVNNKIRISVANTFPEPDKEEMKNYFDRFFRSSQNRTREDNSFGLGLSIAAEIIEAFSGKIECEYTDGIMRFEIMLLK